MNPVLRPVFVVGDHLPQGCRDSDGLETTQLVRILPDLLLVHQTVETSRAVTGADRRLLFGC